MRTTLIDLIENKNVTVFYVGNNGSFDFMVHRQFEELSQTYHITNSVVLAYIPGKKSEYDDFSNTILPEGIETVPKRFAISYRNKWMIFYHKIVKSQAKMQQKATQQKCHPGETSQHFHQTTF